MASYAVTAKKLQLAINKKLDGVKLIVNTQQFFSKDKGRPVTCFIIKRVIDGDKKGKGSVELFKTYSQIQLVLWLRDFWYELNGWDVPQDNEIWEGVKKQYETT